MRIEFAGSKSVCFATLSASAVANDTMPEQTNYMDEKGREHFYKLLKERAKTQTVFVVDHSPDLQARIGTVWTVIKENGVSRFA